MPLRPKIPTDKQMIHRYAVATGTQYYESMEPFLREAFDLSLNAKHSHATWYECQIVILRELLRNHGARRKFTRYKDLVGRALRTLTRSKAPIERIKRAQLLLDRCDRSLLSCDWLQFAFRSLGDALAWRMYEYDRGVLRLLAEHDHVSTPQPDVGLYSELEQLATRATQPSSIALLHSTTNFLRAGDLTYKGADRKLVIEEVKTSAVSNARSSRQTAHREQMQQSLDSGVAIVDGNRIRRIKSDRRFTSHSKILVRAIDESDSRFAASRVVEDYLSFAVLNAKRIIRELPEAARSTISERHLSRLSTIQKRKDDVVLPVTSSLLKVSFFSRLAAPFGLFPLPGDQRYRLITGDLVVFAALNVSGLARWFERRGWRTRIVLPETSPELEAFTYIPGIRLAKGRKAVELPLDVLIMAQHELWTRESIEAQAEAMINQPVHSSTSYSQVILKNEGDTAFD